MFRTCALAFGAAVGGAEGDPARSPRSIESIFKGTGTDKYGRHGYHRYYESELLPFRNLAGVRLMEIGAERGRSLGAWLQYFQDPAIVVGMAYGVDENKSKQNACELMPARCERLDIVSMDQSNKTQLERLKQKFPEGWDIIVDDGSHLPKHQLISFEALWPTVHPGGLYVMEDIETSYWENRSLFGNTIRAGIGMSPPANAVERFKQLVDVVSRKHMGQYDFSVMRGFDKDIARITFGDGIIFCQKAPSDPNWNNFPSPKTMRPRTEWTAGPLKEYLRKIGRLEGSAEQYVPDAVASPAGAPPLPGAVAPVAAPVEVTRAQVQASAHAAGSGLGLLDGEELGRAQDLGGASGLQCAGLLCQVVVQQTLLGANLLVCLLAWRWCARSPAASPNLPVDSREMRGGGRRHNLRERKWVRRGRECTYMQSYAEVT